MIMVDTTVLSNLARVNRTNLLEKLHVQVIVPSQVHEEILKGIPVGYTFLEEADRIVEAEWVTLAALKSESERTLFRNLLDMIGQRESTGIAIAKGLSLVLFSDNRKAREVAESLGVEISGTSGVLGIARSRAKALD